MRAFLDVIDIVFLRIQHVVVDPDGEVVVTMCHENSKDLVVTAVLKFCIKSKSAQFHRVTSLQIHAMGKERGTISHDLQEKIKEYLVVLFKPFFEKRA